MKKLIALIATISIAVFAYISFNKNHEETSSKPTIKIGATLPLTGDAADAGQATKAALLMTLETLNKNNLKYNYHLVFEDNQMNGNKTAITTNKLIASDKVKAVFSIWGLMANVANTINDRNNVIGMSCAFGENPAKGTYNFNSTASYENQAEILTKEFQKRGIKSVALFIDNSDIREQYEIIEKALRNANIKIAFKEYFNMGEKDYKMAIAKAEQNKHDFYMISGYPPSPFLFIKQLKEITGRNDNITSIDAIGELTPEEKKIAEGLWYVDSNLTGLPAFEEELLEKTGWTSLACSGHIAANLQILVAAYENAELKDGETIPDNDSIKDWILKNIKDFDTVSGKATVKENGFINIPPSIKIIKDGKNSSLY
ncbi:MAG: ABC transporter substrate-binding protein [Lactobacillus sp.]|jgi:branched-chain amino acid transport system substrate-binding protein|nr:ABC transporter substrate-binding protein [Lactobacillus sp.]